MNSKGIAYFDCFSGISGDMVLGALVDAGADLAALERELRKLNLPGWSIAAEKVRRGAIVATQVKVRAEEHKGGEQEVSSGAKAQVHGGGHTVDLKHAETPGHSHKHGEVEEKRRRDADAISDSAGRGHAHHHRGLSEIVKMIDAARLSPRAAERAKKIFHRLGEAEAKVHGVPVEKVHFHEVGAVDSIVDIVGAAVGFDLLGIDEFGCSAFDVGGGQVKTEHGVLPVPAPATVELLRGAPTHSSGVQRELVTPTGAAIATTLAASFGAIPAMSLRSVGYGAGSADLAEKPNVLRLLIGERIESEAGESFTKSGFAPANPETRDSPITVVETNVDDMSPQIYGYFAEKALAAGALDVFATPAQMKKNRPGLLVTILSEAQNVAALIDLLFRETTTIGVRTYEVRRKTLDREFVPVETRFGRVRVKVSRMNGSLLNATPEYDDCQVIAAERGVPLKEVIAAASFEFEAKRQGSKEAAKHGEKKGS